MTGANAPRQRAGDTGEAPPRILDGSDYWRERLAGAPVLELPADRPRTVGVPAPTERVSLVTEPEAAAAVHALAARCGVPPGAVLVAVFAEVLARHTGERDVVTGLAVPAPPIPGLPAPDRPAAVLPVRLDVAGEVSLGELVARAGRVVQEASEHQDMPLEAIVRRVAPGTHHAHPLFTTCLQVVDSQIADNPAGVPADGYCAGTGCPPLDLVVTAVLAPAGLTVHARYAPELFDRDRIERLLSHLERMLATADGPDVPVARLEMLPKTEQDRLLSWGTGRRVPVGETMLPGLVAAQAARTPDRVAVAADDGELTYAELVAASGRIAHLLRARGVGAGSMVGVCADRGVDMVPALLGVLAAGAAYVPVDPWFPAERVRFMLADCGARVLLTFGYLLDRLPADALARVETVCLDRDRAQIAAQPAEPPGPPPGGADPAYVIYTSGSTGVPKGVAVPHRGLVNLLTGMVAELGVTAEDVLLAITTPSFDIAALEFFAPLLVGARTVVAARESVTDGRLMAERMAACGATLGQGTPMTWRLLVDAGWRPPPGFRLVSGGETLPPDLAGRLIDLGAVVWNGYGPTETTIYSTIHAVRTVSGPVPLGGPLPNTDLRVLDKAGRLAPVGVAGELYIGGVGLAAGYLNRPELTAERFGPDPFEPDGTLYRTGDGARWRADGLLEFLGRLDLQVKLHGFRIEPAEIDTVLRGHAEVGDAVTVLRSDVATSARLVSYVTRRDPGADPARLVGGLRALARSRLPGYMVPSAVVVLDALPATPNGKVDRCALRPPGESAFEFADYVAPDGDTQRRLAEAFGEVLGVTRVGARDNFFDLGGDSLRATGVVARLRREVPGLGVRDIYATPVVAGLAAALGAAAPRAAGPVEPPVRPRPADLDRIPLSFQQEQLWFLDQMEPGEATYNTVQALRMSGPLDVGALRRALDTVQARHEVLRTVFPTLGEVPGQVVRPPSPVPLRRDDLGALPADRREDRAFELADEEASEPFDLRAGPLLRARLIRLSDTDHLLVVCTHHIVFDGWSQAAFTAELAGAYSALVSGREPQLPDLPVQFGDFAVWQRDWLTGEVLDGHLEFWRERLAGAAVLELPTDRPRPAMPSSGGQVLTRQLPAELLAGLRGLAGAHGVSLFMTLLAGFEVLLSRYTGQDDLVVGTATAGRNRPAYEALVGFFVNMVVLRADLSGNPSFADVLGRVREMTLDAYEHQDVPFEKVVEAVAPRRDASRNPLFQVAFGLLPPSGARTARFDGLEVAPHVVNPGTARFDLSVNVSETDEGLSLWLEYATDLFDQPRMVRLLDHFEQVLRAVVADPSVRLSRVPLLTDTESRAVLVDWQPVARPYRRELVHAMVVEQAERTPEAVAATFEGESISYAELEHRSGLLARHLRGLGVGPGDVVGIAVPRGLDVPVCLLGVLRAGAAFVPVDLSHPAERVGYVLADSGAPVVVSTSQVAGRLPAGGWATVCVDTDDMSAHAGDRLVETASLGSGCYLLYTSGSTGRPKGVLVEHHALATYLDF
ncbi:MAG TPA: amino acid adenylation domain-containing protein, partial [Mycobacteriales bacterium]|nr:amino acid adenylation domain-containing protein [Mycobacteriales bacterium]